jgi:hypothetical protein
MNSPEQIYDGYLEEVAGVHLSQKSAIVEEQKNKLRENWEQYLQQPDWYIHLEPFLQKWIYSYVHGDNRVKAVREPFYLLVADMFESGEIPLASNKPDFDKPRRRRIKEKLPPIDTLIVHHSEADVGEHMNEQPKLLNAIGAIRQYAFEFAKDPELRGKPIWSGHFTDEGRQVFSAYNGVITPDGSLHWLLEDKERQYMLWHAGGEINDRSAALVVVGNYEHSTPPIDQIDGLANAIRGNYNDVSFDTAHILGHREVNSARTCPGDQFLGENGWKNKLLAKL